MNNKKRIFSKSVFGITLLGGALGASLLTGCGGSSSNPVTINYDLNGANTTSVASTTTEYEQSLSGLTSISPTWEGHTFLGWYTVATAGSRRISDGSRWDAVSTYVNGTKGSYNLTLYAHWLDDSDRETKELGSYPQSDVTSTLGESLSKAMGILDDEGTYSNLPTYLVPGKWTSYQYFDFESYTDYMWYQDFNYVDTTGNNNSGRYRAVYFTSYRPYNCALPSGEDYTFQKANGYLVSTPTDIHVYWFKFDPIKWKVLDSSTGLAITKNVLDSRQYYRTIYGHMDTGSNSCNYAESDIRRWLNDSSFYGDNNIFSTSDKAQIASTVVDNSYVGANLNADPNKLFTCDDTSDHVFLLNNAEYSNSKYFADDYARRVTASDYAKCQGILQEGGFVQQWTRSPMSDYVVQSLDSDGSLTRSDYCWIALNGIRPAITLKASN